MVDQHTCMIALIEKRNTDVAEEMARKHAADFKQRVMLYVGANLAGTVRLGDGAE